jgi:hypothetical protein
MDFDPAVLTPFYRYEVWELYLATGGKIFRNKDLAVKIGEVYNNARSIEKQVADIEVEYNGTFMRQVGRAAASGVELMEVIGDEESQHLLSPQDLAELLHIGESMEEARFSTLEARSVVEMKVRRMKKTVAATNTAIDAVVSMIDSELKKIRN